MSTTAQVIINASFRKLEIYDSGSAPTAQQTADALEALNDMLAAWEARGISMGSTLIASAGATITAPDYAVEALKYNLALRIAPEYGKTPSAEVIAGAKTGLKMLENQAMEMIEADMQHLPRRIYVYNINNG